MTAIRRVSGLGLGGESAYVDGSIVNADISASAGIAQSKVASLTTDLAAKAPSASPTFTGTTTITGQLAMANAYTYNGDNTGQVAIAFNGEAIKPQNTYINIGSLYNSGTGRFTVPVAGYVLCSFNSLITRNLNTSHAYVEFQVDGVRKSVRNHTMYDIGGNYTNLSNTAIVYCPANSYVTCNLWTPQASAYGDMYGLGLTFRFLG